MVQEIAKYTPETRIAISSIIPRWDKPYLNVKIAEINESILQLCNKFNIEFINNENIGSDQLNGSKLHLNKEGNITLAKNIINVLKNN